MISGTLSTVPLNSQETKPVFVLQLKCMGSDRQASDLKFIAIPERDKQLL